MSEACAACENAAPGESRGKGVALFVGAIAFCPCHLPATIAGISALGGAAWITGNQVLVYLAFGVTYLFVIGFGLRYLFRQRAKERERDALHVAHASAPAAS